MRLDKVSALVDLNHNHICETHLTDRNEHNNDNTFNLDNFANNKYYYARQTYKKPTTNMKPSSQQLPSFQKNLPDVRTFDDFEIRYIICLHAFVLCGSARESLSPSTLRLCLTNPHSSKFEMHTILHFIISG